MKKYILSISILLVLILGSAIFFPYLFKDKIIEIVKTEANKNLKAKLDFNPDIGINIFKSFPNLNLSLKDISLVHADSAFSNDTFMHADKLEVSFDLLKFYKEQQYIFRSISIKQPFLNLESASDSIYTWDIMLSEDESETKETSDNINFELAKIEIVDGTMLYNDGGTAVKIEGINHQSKGNYNPESFTLDAHTQTREVTVVSDGVAYLNGWSIEQSGDIKINLAEDKYTLPKNELLINGLATQLDGGLQLKGDDILFDIKAASKSSDLNQFLTLIPAVYTSDYASMQTKGDGDLKATFVGTYNETSFPAYDLKLDVAQGWFKYPDLPLPAENIDLNLHVYSIDGNTDHTVIDIPKLHFEIDKDPFDAQLNMRDIFGNSLIDAKAKGRIVLANVLKIMPLENTTLEGTIVSDVELRGRINDISNSAIDRFVANGAVETNNLKYKTAEMNEMLEVRSGKIRIKNQQVFIPTFDGSIGKNDLNFSGKFDNFFAYMLDDKTLTGSATLIAKRFNVNDFLVEDAAPTGGQPTEVEMTLVEVPGNVKLNLYTSIENLIYDDLELKNFAGNFEVDNKTLAMKNVSTELLGGRVSLDGAYAYDEIKPMANFDLSYTNIRLADLLQKFNIIRAFAPLAEQVQALTTAKLSFASELNQDMSPKLANTNLGGVLNLQNVKIDKLASLQSIDKKLGTNHFNVQKLQDFLLKFEIKDGKLLVSPFDLFIDSSTLTLEGVSKLDGSLAYSGFLKIPGSYVKNETTVLNNLTKGTSFSNLTLNPKDYLDIAINIGGTVKKPEVSLNLREIKTSIKQSVQNAVTQEVDKRKEQIEQTAQNELNKIKEETERKAAEAKAKLEAEIERKKKEAEERLRQEAEDKKKKLKEEAAKRLKGLLDK